MQSWDRVIGLSPVYDYIYCPRELHNVSLYEWISRCKREPVKKNSKCQTGDDVKFSVPPEEDTIDLELDDLPS